MTPDAFVIEAAGAMLRVLMVGAVSLLGFSILKEISR